jgi:AraC-like DNA-binding protein
LISGDVTYNIDGQNYSLLPYDLIFIPSLSYHFVTFKSNATYENYVINFSHNFIDETRLNKLFIPPYIKNISHASKLRRMFTNFDFYHETYSTSDFEEASHYLLNEILLLSCYTSFDQKNLHLSSEQSIIPIITSYISQNLESELNVDILAQELRFSKSYIKNCFSTVMGIGIQHYINQKKIRAAHIDILNGMDVNGVAEKYGYQDYSSFYRQYLKIIGTSPSKTKKQIL